MPGYCSISQLLTAVIAKVLALPAGAYIDDFSSLFWLRDVGLPRDIWDFICSILRVSLHEDKFYEGVRPLFLGMQIALSPSSISLRLSTERRAKYSALICRYLKIGGMTSQAAEIADRLN